MPPADPPAALTALAKALRQADEHVFTGVYTGLGTASMAICRCGWQGRDWDGHRAEAILHDGFLALPASERAALAAVLFPPPTVREDPEPDGSLDDFVIDGGITMFHIERMDTGVWWAGVYLADGSRYTFHLSSRRKIEAFVAHEPPLREPARP